MLDCDRVKNTDDAANNISTDKVVAVGGSKRKVCILPILVVVIGTSGFIVNIYIWTTYAGPILNGWV